MNMDHAAEIADRITAAVAAGRPIEGVLFHGTAERIKGPLEPGGDGVLWTSRCPVIAQQYIPSSGIVSIAAAPSAYELDQRVRPNTNSPFYTLAVALTGLEVTDVERDQYGDVVSWRIPSGWPTYAQVMEFAKRELGYDIGRSGAYEFRTVLEGGTETIMPAAWKMPGMLFMTLEDGIEFVDMRSSDESDLMNLEYHDLEGFAAVARAGGDGVIINDFAQTDLYGNFGHRSYGLTVHGLKKANWISIPATRFELDEIHPFPVGTPDLLEWISSIEQGHDGPRP